MKNLIFLFFFLLISVFIINTSTAQDNTVTLAWDANPEPDVVGYRIHYGTESGNHTVTIDAGPALTLTIDNLETRRYYAVATAYNSAGLESLPSIEIDFTFEPGIKSMTLSIGNKTGSLFPITLRWESENNTSIVGYKVHIGDESGNYNRVVNVGNRFSLTTSLPYAVTYFTVTGYFADGTQTDMSQEMTISLIPSIKSWTIVNSIINVQVKGFPNANYGFEISTDTIVYTLEETKTSNTNGEVTFTYDATGIPQLFYRIRLQ